MDVGSLSFNGFLYCTGSLLTTGFLTKRGSLITSAYMPRVTKTAVIYMQL
jgi:hypothetical protein